MMEGVGSKALKPSKQKRLEIPPYDALMDPLFQSIKQLGGSGTVEEINNKVAEIAGLSNEQLEVLHNPERGGITEVEYRLGWSRTYLKKFGVLENSARGVWALTSKGTSLEQVNPQEVKRAVKKQFKEERAELTSEEQTELGRLLDKLPEVEIPDPSEIWRDRLISVILKMHPSAFERLVQRLLRESGFIQVEVTGRSGDGGIDGRGIIRLGGLLSFHVIFQCKRWKGAVSVKEVRDFRGAMVGRADKGLLIPAGSFTQEAVKEAIRDGAPPIDLIDGDQLADKLKELGLGVGTKIVQTELVQIDQEWFAHI
jgi:restriction system protein